jgi:hypothetical protein
MTDEKYNGFTNYETWAVNLWIMNDEGLYQYWEEETQDAPDVTTLADTLNEWLKDNNPVDTAGLYSDLLNSAISSVNCHEIAGLLWADFKPAEDQE